MKKQICILLFLLGTLIFPELYYAQTNLKNTLNDDLGDNEDKFQELFYEGLKQKGIENYDRAAEAFEKCLEIDEAVPVLYFELGKSYHKLKNFKLAEDALKKAVEKDPDNEWFLDALYGFYVSQNEHDKALKTVRQLVKFHPDYKEDLAALYVRIKNYDDALNILNELDAKFGVSVSRDVLRNRIYKATGRKKDQIKNLENRVKNSPEKVSNYLALIFRYSENNEKEKAFKTAKALLKINPNSQLVHLALYKFYLDDNEAEKAIASMKIVVTSTKIKPDAKRKVFTDFVNFVKKNPKYETDLIEATAMVSGVNNSKSVIELGQYYLSKNNKVKALESFESALKLEPNNFGVIQNVLLLYLDFSKYDLTKEKSAEALEIFPSQPILYLINGVALNELKKAKEALEVLETGLDYIIDDSKMEADFYTQLSKAYTLLNNTTKAKTFRDKAKQLETLN